MSPGSFSCDKIFRSPEIAVCVKGCSDSPRKQFVVRDVQMSLSVGNTRDIPCHELPPGGHLTSSASVKRLVIHKLDVKMSDVCTGLGFITSNRLREYEVKKLRSPACSRLENAIFLPCIHATDRK